ncbi:MAG: NADH-quinone oxidoreductase subunit H [Euryarchaeota archaeon]|nr:NADH-quinone oxidoreductase subunit H [Euryarchaeota archaeon]
MNILLEILYLFIFPGFLFILGFGLFAEYMDRKIYARIQRRVGPPFLQPLADTIKLMAKEDFVPEKADKLILTLVPIFSLAAVIAAFLYIPVVSANSLYSFEGDLIVALYLLMIPTLALFLGGWYSGNIFGQEGGMRVASLLFSYEIPFFLALLVPALISGTWDMTGIVLYMNNHWLVFPFIFLGFVIAVISLQGKLERLPFDIPEAETEIVAGPLAEFSGRRLALLRLARDAEMVVGAGLIAVVFLGGPEPLISIEPHYISWIIGALVFLLKTLFVIFLLILMKSAVARIRVDQMVNFTYKWLIPLSLLQMLLVIVVRFGGWLP